MWQGLCRGFRPQTLDYLSAPFITSPWSGTPLKSTMEDSVIVNVTQGSLRGKRAQAKFGSLYFSFQGIPYAAPPVGPLRFKSPQPVESWDGVRSALAVGPACAQKGWIIKRFTGEENCLFLNVYTPELPNSNNPRKPVMVWIHGGGYAIGSGNTDLYGPDYLMENGGIVLVTINYRLGVLGFLSLEDSSVPGNAGLKDQVAALKWVQENIINFGGDPNNVTIFGESAGGSSVHCHLLSPMSKGLFHKAIAQSGSSLNPWAFTKSPRNRAFKLGEALNYTTSDPEDLLRFLRSVSVQELVNAVPKTLTKEEHRYKMTLPFLPISEDKIEGNEDMFLPGNPLDLLKAGKFHQVPYLTGITSHEGMLELEDIMENPGLLKTLNEDFERHVPKGCSVPNETVTETASRMKKFYFGNKDLNITTLEEYVHLNTDYWFAHGIDFSIQLQACATTFPIYYYQFSFNGALGLFKRLLQINDVSGASHLDDLGYLFRTCLLDVDVKPNSPERKTITRMVKMWTNFAKTGNPTPVLDSDIDVLWPPYTTLNPVYLDINTKLTTGRNLLKKRIDFWNDLYGTRI